MSAPAAGTEVKGREGRIPEQASEAGESLCTSRSSKQVATAYTSQLSFRALPFHFVSYLKGSRVRGPKAGSCSIRALRGGVRGRVRLGTHDTEDGR